MPLPWRMRLSGLTCAGSMTAPPMRIPVLVDRRASVRGTVHTGAIGYYASRIADAGMAAVGVVAGVPNMAYAGAKGAAVATSPLAVAVPAGSTARHGDRRLARSPAAAEERGRRREPTTDPALAKVPTPVGGEGCGHVLVFEMPTRPDHPVTTPVEGRQAPPPEASAVAAFHRREFTARRTCDQVPPRARHHRDPRPRRVAAAPWASVAGIGEGLARTTKSRLGRRSSPTQLASPRPAPRAPRPPSRRAPTMITSKRHDLRDLAGLLERSHGAHAVIPG